MYRVPLRIVRPSLTKRFISVLPTTEDELELFGPRTMRSPKDEMTQSLVAEKLLSLYYTNELLSPSSLESWGDTHVEIHRDKKLSEHLHAIGVTSDVEQLPLEDLISKIPSDSIKEQLKHLSSQIGHYRTTTYEELEQNKPLGPRRGLPTPLLKVIEKYQRANKLESSFLFESAIAIMKTPMSSFPLVEVLTGLEEFPNNTNLRALACILASTVPHVTEEQFTSVLRTSVIAEDYDLFNQCIGKLRLINTDVHNGTFVKKISKGSDSLPWQLYSIALEGMLKLKYSESEMSIAINNLLTGIVVDKQTQEVSVRIYYNQRKSMDANVWNVLPQRLLELLAEVAVKFEFAELLKNCIKQMSVNVQTGVISRHQFLSLLQRLEAETSGHSETLLSTIKGLQR
ncbi:unnamed protein product [Cyberlindnera jadinii]|uniref:Uncharacterized protein n=1 Tax=Cyberlindnera jadinii (strain ATCC 18201 / CBS 1600 / BCRC 20928 / JCM 3617 / NBRC 0987 / NRRL Y-1542) TaxID=983966 RepID=A0A0H5C3L1_CYBJN|nr:hypothetical protein CYBJADRAFT_168241 [Cyberlindnera jadinii NRRL Y-1542]ODV72696.1 hypothetical protein CYBJADRAFT_168241 [Cyberlindnera jadinii NRRL Y-1542]CEP22267.1 unnamed protein product [Cyberlindnera jadinii]